MSRIVNSNVARIFSDINCWPQSTGTVMYNTVRAGYSQTLRCPEVIREDTECALTSDKHFCATIFTACRCNIDCICITFVALS